MKISLDWLKTFIELETDPGMLVDVLNNIGLVVDEKEEKNGDVILDIETYANRPDTLGHLGIARELAAALDKELREPSWPFAESPEKTADLADVQIWEEDLCPRYCGIIVKGVCVGPSPDWLRKRIEAVGLIPINNVVDVTNYVLYSTAHPIHAFDLAKIGGSKIIIRRGNKGERFQDLEGRELSVSSGHLVIADDKKPIALAGVIGGVESAISETTKDVFIESACFDPVSIRLTSKQTGIQTDASYRFERGADWNYPPQAALMAASLISQTGGKVTRGLIDVFPKPQKSKSVLLRSRRISELLGVDIDPSFVERILVKLGFRPENHQKGSWQVRVPSFRVDIEREADLIEEVARFYGYEKIPSKLPPFSVLDHAKDPNRRRIDKIKEVLVHYGFDEAVNFTFSDPEKDDILGSGRRKIEIRNPISSKASVLRTTLIGGLLENIIWNRNRGAEGIHLFEIGNLFFWRDDEARENLTLALVTTGFLGTVNFQEKRKPSDFFHLKGACESLMNHLRFEAYVFKEESHPFFAKNRSLSLEVKGQTIGYLGRIREAILTAYGIKEGVWAAEIDLEKLFDKQPCPFTYSPFAKYPSVSRDIAFLADKGVSYSEIQESIRKLSLSHLEDFYLYDRFTEAPVPKGKASLSFRFVFRSSQRTLLAEEVDQLQEKIISVLSDKFGFKLREGG